MITLKNVDKYFNRGRSNEIHVTNNVSLSLPDHGMVALFGRSGCGKTTLLNLIGGLDRFDGGEIYIGDKSIRSNPDEIRNEDIGYIFQNYNLNPEETCFQNVADGLLLAGIRDEKETEERVMLTLRAVGMENYRNRLPGTLSGGQQQRIAIARAIVKNPAIVLADEPTGNLDDANTLNIMKILKEISRERLVLLVTHEANLVDDFCDTVVELSDGQIVNVRQNENAGGIRKKGRNDIYLGELAHSKSSPTEPVQTDIYSDEETESSLSLTVVHKNGKTYLKINTPGVKIIDNSSEIKLVEGAFEETLEKEEEPPIVIPPLPPVTGKIGWLYSFPDALKAGFRSLFFSKKKGRKALQVVLSVFSVVLVFITALCGTGIQSLIQLDKSYNHNVFYVYLAGDDADEVAKKLSDAVGTNGIDNMMTRYTYASLYSYYSTLVTEENAVTFVPGNFSSFDTYSASSFSTNAIYLPLHLGKSSKLIAGKNATEDGKILITKAVADALLENSSFSYIQEYEDLLGMTLQSSFRTDDGEYPDLYIVGITDETEPAVYVPESLLSATMIYERALAVEKASDYNLTVANGQAVYHITYFDETKETDYNLEPKLPKDAEISLLGRTFTAVDYKVTYDGEMEVTLLLSDSDYDSLYSAFGETDKRFCYNTEEHDNLFPDGDNIEEQYYYYDFYDSYIFTEYSDGGWVEIHTTDVEKTEQFLLTVIPDNNTFENRNYSASFLETPELLRNYMFSLKIGGIIGSIVTLVIFLVLMCICMYFIMRSALLPRMRELAIARAIGVTRKNLSFRHFIEVAEMTAFTVFPWFLIASCLLFVWQKSPVIRSTLFYPVWLALILLVVLLAVSLLCGMLPIRKMLRKTPSQLLSSYDI